VISSEGKREAAKVRDGEDVQGKKREEITERRVRRKERGRGVLLPRRWRRWLSGAASWL
jgi:hypothetical protein